MFRNYNAIFKLYVVPKRYIIESDDVEDIDENVIRGQSDGCIRSAFYTACRLNWKSYREDLCSFSSLFPNTVFMLSITENEEEGIDLYEYFRDGKYQRCEPRIVYDDYDPKKLQSLD